MNTIVEWLDTYTLRLIITAVVCLAYVVLDRISAPRIRENVGQSGFKNAVALKAVRTSRSIFAIVGTIVIAAVWGIGFNSVLIFTSTTLTLLGVALFANWSLLSNITAYFLLLLQPHYRLGTFIRVIDADNYVEGSIAEITIFCTKLTSTDDETIVYPNNLLLSKLIIVEPTTRLSTAGKLPAEERGESKRQFARRDPVR